MLDLSPNESKLIERVRSIGYESMSEDELISALIESESAKIEKIRKEFTELRHKFF